MESTIFLKISTPLKTEFKGDVSYIEVPTVAGMIGIYPNHIPMITALEVGTLKLRLPENETIEFGVKGGFLRLSQNKCTIAIKTISKSKNIA